VDPTASMGVVKRSILTPSPGYEWYTTSTVSLFTVCFIRDIRNNRMVGE
jgi:hypothetical protein